MPDELKKYEIINMLARRWQYQFYLEVCTPSTGFTFGQVDAECLKIRDRFVYRCPRDEDDGSIYTYRTTAESSLDVLSTIWTAKGEAPTYDLIFVDPWHSYDASSDDLRGAWKLLKPGGRMVIHDCNPPDAEFASPQHRWGGWCGETYRAYIDFLAFNTGVEFLTVDTDFGCGVLRKLEQDEMSRHPVQLLLLWLQWQAAPHGPGEKYEFFERHREKLIQLIDAEEFVSRQAFAREP